jgi:hypothetical protein
MQPSKAARAVVHNGIHNEETEKENAMSAGYFYGSFNVATSTPSQSCACFMTL